MSQMRRIDYGRKALPADEIYCPRTAWTPLELGLDESSGSVYRDMDIPRGVPSQSCVSYLACDKARVEPGLFLECDDS